MPDPKTSEETAVATVGSTAVVTLNEQLLADAGVGTQYQPSDLSIAFTAILQSNSPQTQEGTDGYVDGAKPGMLINTVTHKLADVRILNGKDGKAMRAIFGAQARKMFVEWVPREKGGGFVKQYLADDPVVTGAKPDPDRPNRLLLPNGNILTETDYHFPLIVDDVDAPTWSLIGMSSTALKVSRNLNTYINDAKIKIKIGDVEKIIKPPIFALVFDIRTKLVKKNDQTWWTWDVRYAGSVMDLFGERSDEVYATAKGYYTAIAKGLARMPTQPSPDEEQGAEKEETPF